MLKFNTKDISILGIFAALIIVLSQIPGIGFIPLPFSYMGVGVGATIIHIIVIIGITSYYHFTNRNVEKTIIAGIILGMVFGINSMIVALVRPSSVIEELFRNPFVSILPRVLFGAFVAVCYSLIMNTKVNKFISLAIIAGLSTVLHSVMVVAMIFMFGHDTLSSIFANLIDFVKIVFVANCIAETILACLITAPIVGRLAAYLEA